MALLAPDPRRIGRPDAPPAPDRAPDAVAQGTPAPLREELERLLGPDPGSTNIATIGGVIANNSGGMRCGTTWDPYSTVESMTLVLASGAVVDTAAPDAEERFAAAEPELAAGLTAIRDELRDDAALA